MPRYNCRHVCEDRVKQLQRRYASPRTLFSSVTEETSENEVGAGYGREARLPKSGLARVKKRKRGKKKASVAHRIIDA